MKTTDFERGKEIMAKVAGLKGVLGALNEKGAVFCLQSAGGAGPSADLSGYSDILRVFLSGHLEKELEALGKEFEGL